MSEGSDVDRPTHPKKRKEVSPTMPGTSRVKRTMLECDQDELDELADATNPGKSVNDPNSFDRMHAIVQYMTKWATSQYKSKKLTVNQINDIKSKMSDMTELLSGLEKTVIRLEGRLEGRQEMAKMMGAVPRVEQTEFPRLRSYAEVSAVPKITGAKKVVQPPKVVFIKSKDEKKTIEEVKREIQTTIQPKDLGIKIRRVVKTARGIMIETDKVDQLQKLQDCEALKTKGLVVEAPRKRSPRVMI